MVAAVRMLRPQTVSVFSDHSGMVFFGETAEDPYAVWRCDLQERRPIHLGADR